MNRVRNSFAILIPAFAVAFIVFAVIELFFSPERGILPSFLLSWHLLGAFVSSCDFLIPLFSASIFLSFGLFADTGSDTMARSRGPVGFVLVAAFLCAGILLFLKPVAERKAASISKASALFTEEFREGSRALEAGEWARAEQALDVMGSISANDKNYREFRRKYSERPGAASRAAARTDGAGTGAADKTEKSANEYYLNALEAYGKGQFFLAHSLATRASRIDPKRLDAVRLAAQAWGKIGTLEDSAVEKTQRETARLKREAYEVLRSGDPISAYRRFLDLKARAPGDADVVRYLKESLDGMKSVAFFIDEIGKLSKLPRSRAIFLRMPSEKKDDASFIAASSLYLGEEVAYFVDFEYLQIENGTVKKKISAPYAKARAGRVILACYDRADPSRAWKPVYVTGGTGQVADNVLDSPLSREDLGLGAIAATSPVSASITDLLRVYAKGRRIAMDPGPFLREGLSRVHVLIAIIFTALFSFFLGARYRYMGSKKPWAQAIIVGPIAFLAASAVLSAGRWASSVLSSALAPKTGSPMEIASSFLIFFLVQALFVGIALILIAGHRDRPAV